MIALAIFLLLYTNNMNSSASNKAFKVENFRAIITEQLINLEKELGKDDESLKLIKKYTLKGDYNKSTREEIRALCTRLGIQEEWFYKLVDLESNGNPQAINKITNATGLIQFMPTTAKALGTSTKDLYKMSVSEQLIWIEKYLSKMKPDKKFNSFLDLYFAVFYPKAMGKPSDYIIGSEVSLRYAKKVQKQNRGIDKAGDNDGFLTPNDVENWTS